MKGDTPYPAIGPLLTANKFEDMIDRVVIIAEAEDLRGLASSRMPRKKCAVI
jgi:hypothetical protein